MTIHVWQLNGVMLKTTVLMEKMKKIVALVSCLLRSNDDKKPSYLFIFQDLKNTRRRTVKKRGISFVNVMGYVFP